jgi:hypothetical protein
MKKTLILLLAIALAGLLTACGAVKETELSGADQDTVLAYSEAKTDNLVTGLKAGDYAVFSKDFDKPMLAAMTQGEFNKLKQDRDARLGAYVSRKVNRVLEIQSGKYVSVVYDAVFEKDDNVTMRVVFQADEPHAISGLWFNK